MIFHTVGVCVFHKLPLLWNYSSTYRSGCQYQDSIYLQPHRAYQISNTQFERKAVMIHMAMVKDQMFGKTMRKSYAKYQEILEMPNMLKIQKDSYQWFLDEGLREVFKDVGVITDFSGKLELSFLDYSMNDKPKYTIEECKERDATYAKPIKVRVRLRNTETEEIKEQERRTASPTSGERRTT